MNLTGKWTFKEEFDFGKDEGHVVLAQAGNRLFGILEFTEHIEGETPFKVKCQVEGTREEDNIKFEVTDFEIMASEQIEYYAETREGVLNANGQIVGSSQDKQGVCGVFVMEKIN